MVISREQSLQQLALTINLTHEIKTKFRKLVGYVIVGTL